MSVYIRVPNKVHINGSLYSQAFVDKRRNARLNLCLLCLRLGVQWVRPLHTPRKAHTARVTDLPCKLGEPSLHRV